MRMFKKFPDDFFVYTYIRFFIVSPWYYKYLYTLSPRKRYFSTGIAGVLISLLLVHILTPTVAASTWTQTSDSDFGAGTNTSVRVNGTGASASVVLNGGTFTKRRTVTIDNSTVNGTYITKWGSQGSGNGQFNQPQGVAIDSSGNVYVTDLQNSRVQKFTSSGTYVTQWGSYGSGNGQFYYPYGITVDSADNVYVTDSSDGSSRVQKFTSSGTYVTQWGSYGTGNGQFHNPYGITVDSADNVYVVDRYNNRIQKFTSSGTYVAQWGGNGGRVMDSLCSQQELL